MDVYFLATRALVPKECIDCQASAILYQPEPKQLTPPPHPQTPPTPTQTLLHPKGKPHEGALLEPLVNDPPFWETFFKLNAFYWPTHHMSDHTNDS